MNQRAWVIPLVVLAPSQREAENIVELLVKRDARVGLGAVDLVRAAPEKPKLELRPGVYSREECVFHYCGQPDYCRANNRCAHVR